MNGNYKYTLTDEQRNSLAYLLDGVRTKRLAKRNEICAVLDGALAVATGDSEKVRRVRRSDLAKTFGDKKLEERLKEMPADQHESYMIGWNGGKLMLGIPIDGL